MVRVLLFLAFLSVPMAALAHSWYSQSCCSDKDCAPIPADAVIETSGGWIVELAPGDHPMVATYPFSEFVPFDSALTSQDGDYHACVRAETPSPMTPTERVICLYVPNPGGTS
jgi:hypothetical protein